MSNRSNRIRQEGKNDSEIVKKSEYCFKPFIFRRPKNENLWPRARSGHRLVSNEDYVFVYGGYNPDLMLDHNFSFDDEWLHNKPLFREVWKFNITKEKWSKVPAVNIPNELASNAVVLEGPVLMVYGGTSVPFGQHCSNSLYVCNLKDKIPEFKEIIVKGELPEALYGQAVFVYKHFFYVIGGTTGYDYSCDVHRLDLLTGNWEVIRLNRRDDPPGRYRHEIGLQLHKKKVYILGGGTAHYSFGLEQVPVFDLELNTWSTIMTNGDPKVSANNGFPVARRFHSLVQAVDSDDIFITGGESGGNGVHSDTWRLNLETFQWTRIDSLKLKQARYFHAASLSPQGKMYLFGGISQSSRTDEMLCAWLCVPKLQEICWEAIHYYNLLDDLSLDSLRQLIPPEFLRRLD